MSQNDIKKKVEVIGNIGINKVIYALAKFKEFIKSRIEEVNVARKGNVLYIKITFSNETFALQSYEGLMKFLKDFGYA